jgi:hypothetical protein
MKMTVRFSYVLMGNAIDRDTPQFANFTVDIASLNARGVKPAPFRISKISKWSAEPWDPELGAQLDVADTLEYRGRCMMALAAFVEEGGTLVRAGSQEVLEDFIDRQFSDYSDYKNPEVRASESPEAAAERIVRDMASRLRIHDGRLYLVDVVPVYAVLKGGDPLGRGDGALSIEVVPSRSLTLDNGLGFDPPEPARLYLPEEVGAAIERYRSLGGRKRPPTIEKRTDTHFDVDVLLRQLRERASALLDDFGNLLDDIDESWVPRLFGSDIDEIFGVAQAAVDDKGADMQSMLEAIEPLTELLSGKVSPDANDEVWGAIEDIDDAAHRYRGAAQDRTPRRSGVPRR